MKARPVRLLAGFLTVGGWTMASRVLGFVRDILIAGLLGTGPVAEAFFVAFRLPNMFRRFFAEGAFNMAFVPLYAKRLEGDGQPAATRFAEEALLQGRLKSALGTLHSYQSCHSLHMRFEDDKLLPAYAALERQGRWDATLYSQEHRKIEQLYEKIEQELEEMTNRKADARSLRRSIIGLLDREKSYKGLCEHHQEREETSLLVELDRQTDAHWRAKTGRVFRRQWQEKIAQELDAVHALTCGRENG